MPSMVGWKGERRICTENADRHRGSGGYSNTICRRTAMLVVAVVTKGRIKTKSEQRRAGERVSLQTFRQGGKDNAQSNYNSIEITFAIEWTIMMGGVPLLNRSKERRYASQSSTSSATGGPSTVMNVTPGYTYAHPHIYYKQTTQHNTHEYMYVCTHRRNTTQHRE